MTSWGYRSRTSTLDRGRRSTSSTGTVGYTGLATLNRQFQFNLQALQAQGKARVRANPRIATVSGRHATIFVGNERYVATPIDNGQGGQKNSIDAGVRLDVTPYTGGKGQVLVDVDTEVSTLSAPDPVTGLPTKSTRTATTTVRADNGQTIVIGGLTQQELRSVRTKIPILGDIPVLGPALFQSKTINDTQTELRAFHHAAHPERDRSSARRRRKSPERTLPRFRPDQTDPARARPANAAPSLRCLARPPCLPPPAAHLPSLRPHSSSAQTVKILRQWLPLLFCLLLFGGGACPASAQLAKSFYNITGIETKTLPNGVQITIRADGAINLGVDRNEFIHIGTTGYTSRYALTLDSFRLRFVGARAQIPAYTDIGSYPADFAEATLGRDELTGTPFFYTGRQDPSKTDPTLPRVDLRFHFYVPIKVTYFTFVYGQDYPGWNFSYGGHAAARGEYRGR